MAAALRAALDGLAQVHAGVEAGHLLGVAVERQRRAASDLADPSLRRLAPARMVDRRVHVRVEAVLAGRPEVPRGRRLGLDEADAHDRLDALEPVLPRDDEAERRAVLVRQRLPVESDGEDRERVHRLVDAKAFDVGPAEDATLLPGHLLRVEERREGDVPGTRRRLDPAEEIAEREAEPRNDHRPGLDAAHAVDALLEREPAEQLVHVDDLRFLYLTVDAHRPGAGPQRAGQLRRVALVGAELVEVVVGGDVAVRRARLVGAVRPVPRDGKLGRVTLRARRLLAGAPAAHEPEKASADAGARRREERGVADELAPPQVHRLRRDIRGGWGRSELRHVSLAIQVRTVRWNAAGSSTHG